MNSKTHNCSARVTFRGGHKVITIPGQSDETQGFLRHPTQPEYTTAPVRPCNTSEIAIEFCRVNDAQRIWGLKRGLIYRKINDGTIRSVTLREPGKKFGVRLLHVESIRSWLISELEAQEVCHE